MKKLLVLVVLLGVIQTADAQEKNIIKTNPIGLAFGNFNIAYERAVSDASSLQFGGNFFFKLFGTDVSGFGLNAAYRYYVTHNSRVNPEGFFVGPRLAFNTFTESSSDASVSTMGIGGLIGYQWVFDINLTLDLGAGPTYLFVVTDAGATETFDGFVPNLILAIGYNF
ncbi:MAG: DUF3575 domain-containing protein [Chitinophagales bacterium]|nr:DUF3575 domain-containing protein [Chitinophagales bacterium]